MLLPNPDVDQMWGGLLLAFSLLAVAIPSYYVVEEYQNIFTEFIRGKRRALRIFKFCYNLSMNIKNMEEEK
jgi:hypothetical protein